MPMPTWPWPFTTSVCGLAWGPQSPHAVPALSLQGGPPPLLRPFPFCSGLSPGLWAVLPVELGVN